MKPMNLPKSVDLLGPVNLEKILNVKRLVPHSEIKTYVAILG